MDVSSIASLATSLQAERNRADVGTAVLKKAMDINRAAAAQMIATLPPPPSMPGNVGKTIDTTA